MAYASRLLSKTERCYSVTRKELLAVVVFLNHFRQYLLGRKFILRTDHGSLVWLHNFKEPEGQLARWLERLEEFQFEIVHRKGKVHCNADALSRIPSDQHDIVHDEFPVSLVLPTVVVGGRSQEDIKNCQVNDELVGPLYQAKIKGVKPSEQSLKGRDP